MIKYFLILATLFTFGIDGLAATVNLQGGDEIVINGPYSDEGEVINLTIKCHNNKESLFRVFRENGDHFSSELGILNMVAPEKGTRQQIKLPARVEPPYRSDNNIIVNCYNL